MITTRAPDGANKLPSKWFAHISAHDVAGCDVHGLGDGLGDGLDADSDDHVGVGDRVDNGLDADISADVGLGADMDGIVSIQKLSFCQTHISFSRMSDT